MWAVMIGLAAALVSVTNFFDPTVRTKEDVVSAFLEASVKPRSYFEEIDGREIHFVELGDPELPLLFFVHGSPGSWSDFMGLMADPKLNQRFHMIAVDRPGQGETGGKYEASLVVQSSYFSQLFDRNRSGEKIILVGHSYGGGVVAQMAVDQKDRIKGVVFAAPTLEPEPQEEWWLRDVGNTPAVRFMLGDWLDNCNQEMLALADELHRLSAELNVLDMKLCIIHGDADVLVDVSNIAYLKSACPGANIKVYTDEEMNHFIPWSHPHLIIESIEYIENE